MIFLKKKQAALSYQRIYAIGDIHGHLEALQQLMDKIIQKEQSIPSDSTLLIFLGDYIDRGEQSAQVIDYLINLRQEYTCCFLKGNHEWALESYLKGTLSYTNWVNWGGEATLRSYGITSPTDLQDSVSLLDQIRHKLQQAIPVAHQDFFNKLVYYYETQEYVFVHAGLRPGVSLRKQSPKDMMMIREEFLEHPVTIQKTIIHGHTIFAEPLVRENAIGIDTGAYKTGKLTAVMLETGNRQFLYSDE